MSFSDNNNNNNAIAKSILEQKLKSNGGFNFGSNWFYLISFVRESFDLVVISKKPQQQQHQQDDAAAASTTTTKKHQLQTLQELLETALFKYNCAFDHHFSGPLFEMLFETMLLLFQDENNQQQQQNKIVEYFSLAFTLPISERSLKLLFLMLEKFGGNIRKSVFGGGEDRDDAVKERFTRMRMAVAFSNEEAKTWPLLVEKNQKTPSLVKEQWIRVLLRRLENPLCITDEKIFARFVTIVVRQMLSQFPESEPFHVVAFLVSVFLEEQQQQNATHESNSNNNSASSAAQRKRILMLKSSLAFLLKRTTNTANNNNDDDSWWLQPEIVAKFPFLVSMLELSIASSKTSAAASTANSISAVSLEKVKSLVSRLKQTTEQLCNTISQSSSQQQNSAVSSITFSWLMHLWIGVISDFTFSTNTAETKDNNNNNSKEDAAAATNNGKIISSLLKDMKKSFRLPGKTATVVRSGDAAFFSEWATNEQLLLGETILHAEIFKQATADAATRNDPTGTPVLVRTATELLQSQRAEGDAKAFLEKAVDRTSSFFGNDVAGTPTGVDSALWSAFSDFSSAQNNPLGDREKIEQRRRQALYGSSHLTNANVEEIARRVNPTSSDFYLWNLRQLSLAGGLVMPSSGCTTGGDIAWTTLFRDLETARRSTLLPQQDVHGAASSAATSAAQKLLQQTAGGVTALATASTPLFGAGGCVITSGMESYEQSGALPRRLPMQTATGFPSLQDFGPNPTRLPLPAISVGGDKNKKSSFVMPEFIFGGGAEAGEEEEDQNDASAATSSTTTKIVWRKMDKMPENPEKILPNVPPENLNDVTGPLRLRPLQRFVIDKTTAARLEREQADEKRRSRRELLQSLASEAVGVVASPEATVRLLESLPEFLLRLTKCSIVAQTALQQMELEENLDTTNAMNRPANDANRQQQQNHHLGGYKVPAASWLIEEMCKK